MFGFSLKKKPQSDLSNLRGEQESGVLPSLTCAERAWEVVIPDLPISGLQVLLLGVSLCGQKFAFHLLSDEPDARTFQVLALHISLLPWPNSLGHLVEDL